MSDVVIASAARTAIGSFGGSFAKTPAVELGRVAVNAALERAGVSPKEVDDVILGHVLTAGLGQNPARQTAIAAGIPEVETALTINQVCGSGLRAVAMGGQAIQCGDAEIVVAGGQENMSLAPHSLLMRPGVKMGDAKFVDTMIKDGLWCAFNNYHMGTTAENIASDYNLSREEQDEFAAWSQNKAETARKNGKFVDEIAPVVLKSRKGETIMDTDEFIKEGVTAEKLSSLRPAFSKDGTITAGNASGLNDSSAATILMSADTAKKRGITPLAKIASWATAGVATRIMGTGPIPAVKRALDKAGWGIGDIDLIEANEAFAAQALSVSKELGFNQDILNVNGGAIALGHPIGASGCRVLITLLYEMQRRDVKKGLATLCIGGGMGIALCVER